MTKIAEGRSIYEPLNANGLLGAAQADIYTAPAVCTAEISTLICHNVHAANVDTVQLFIQPSGGTSRRFVLEALQPGERLESRGEPLQLDAGDAIRGLATNANEVTWTLSGKVIYGVS